MLQILYSIIAGCYGDLKEYAAAEEFVKKFLETMKPWYKESGVSGECYLEAEKKIEEAEKLANKRGNAKIARSEEDSKGDHDKKAQRGLRKAF